MRSREPAKGLVLGSWYWLKIASDGLGPREGGIQVLSIHAAQMGLNQSHYRTEPRAFAPEASSDEQSLLALFDEVLLDVYALAMWETGDRRKAERITDSVLQRVGRRLLISRQSDAEIRKHCLDLAAKQIERAKRAEATSLGLSGTHALVRRLLLAVFAATAAIQITAYAGWLS